MPRDVTLHDPESPSGDPHPSDASDDEWTGGETRLDRAPAPSDLRDLEHRRGENLGRYVLLDPIGRGGSGVVYSAYDPELDRRIALKLLRSPNDDQGQARLAREAQAMAKLVHPNVITVHDVGRFYGGVFVAMELVEGVDLREWMKRGKHDWQEVLGVLQHAGQGLCAAHRAGLVHRDFKPANVLVGDDGDVKVVDFGLARLLDRGLDTNELRMLERNLESSSVSGGQYDQDVTRTGAVMGTPAYMAPEQHGRRTVDARTDQFSFCVTLYEGLFGQRPFDGDNRLMLAMQTNRGTFKEPPRGHSVPARITRAVLRGLSPTPGDRFASMEALLAELSYDPGRRRRRLMLAGATVALVGVGAYGYVRGPETTPPCPDARPALAGAWDDDLRARMEQAFAASGLPYADQSARFVTGRLDAWATEWVDAQRTACEATHVGHTQSEAALELRQQCLDRQRRDLSAATRLLAEADAQTIPRADRLVGSLPDPQACDDLQALGRLAPPTDPTIRAAVEAVENRLGEAHALEAAGDYAQSLEVAKAARVDADATGYAPIMAEALWWVGHMEGLEGQAAQEETTLHRAAQLATEAGHDPLLADVWLDLVWNTGMGQSRHDDGLNWANYAEAVINRLGRPDRRLSRLLCYRGNLLWAKHELDAALEHAQSCLEIRERIMPGAPLVATTHAYVGNVLIDLARYEHAELAFRKGLEIEIAAHGDQHPQVATLHNGLGVVFYHQHRLEEAEAQYQKAHDINLTLLGPEHPDLLYAQGNIAGCRRERGDYDGALEAMLRVEALVTKNFPPVHREVGTTQHNIAELLALQGDYASAIERFDRAVAVRLEVHGTTHPFVANSLTARGESRLALSRDADALADFERALQIRAAADDHREHEYGRTRFGLARALWRTGGDRARALALAERASADFATADSTLKRQRRTALETWRREHVDDVPPPAGDQSLEKTKSPPAAPP